MIHLEFKDLDTLVLISPYGAIEVFYPTLKELDKCLDLLREILVPRSGERLILEARGRYSAVDKIRHLIQDGIINHDTNLTLEEVARLTGWKREGINDLLPTILKEEYPYGIKLKPSRIIAGCSTPERHVEEWLKTVEGALKLEGFYNPAEFQWERDQFFELVKHSGEMSTLVKAFMDGKIILEVKSNHSTSSAYEALDSIFNKYGIPYEKQISVEKTPHHRQLLVGIGLPLVIGTGLILGAIHRS